MSITRRPQVTRLSTALRSSSTSVRHLLEFRRSMFSITAYTGSICLMTAGSCVVPCTDVQKLVNNNEKKKKKKKDAHEDILPRSMLYDVIYTRIVEIHCREKSAIARTSIIFFLAMQSTLPRSRYSTESTTRQGCTRLARSTELERINDVGQDRSETTRFQQGTHDLFA